MSEFSLTETFMFKFIVIATTLILTVSTAHARKWTDSSGNYSFEGDLIAFNETDLVIQKSDKTLVAVDLEQLSKADQEYVTSKEAAEAVDKRNAKQQVWKMASGLEVIADVVDYIRKDITFSMTRGKIYVNDTLFENLTGVQQRVVPLIAAQFTGRPITDRAGLFDWLKRVRGAPQTFTYEGVQMELDNGDLYAVPFFLFSPEALKVLKPGWDEWAAKHSTWEQQQESELRLQTQAQSFQEGQAQTNQLLKLQLQMQAYQAGLFSLWEVVLYPGPGVGGWPLSVVVPGRDSRQAAEAALANNPGYTVGPIARVNRQF
jgi:hypothetical protein